MIKNDRKLKLLTGILSVFMFMPGHARADNCTLVSDCSSLGYTQNAEDCTGAALKCPWDLTKAACEVCNIKNCLKCVSGNSNLCQTCADGYLGLLDFETGFIKSCEDKPVLACRVLNCTTCVDGNSSVCSVCKSGYTLSGGKCVTSYDCSAKYTYYKDINDKMKNALLRNSCIGYTSWNLLGPIKVDDTCSTLNQRLRNEIQTHNTTCPSNQITTINSIRCTSCCDGGTNGYGSLSMCTDSGSGGTLLSI